MFSGVVHIGLTVRNVARAAEFYEALFGTPPEIRNVYEAPYTSAQVGYPDAVLDIAIFRIAGSDIRLELIEYRNPQGTPVETETKNAGTTHLCLMSEDIDKAYRRLVELGAQPRSDKPVRIAAGPNEGRHVFYARDLDGFTIEVLEAALA